MFDACLPLFETYRVTQDAVYFPVLTGRYRGQEVRLEPVADHIVIRKIPSLWLRVSVMGEVPFRGALDFLVRPENVEFYSPYTKLEERVPVPPEWPQFARLRSDDSERMPPLELVSRHMGFFDDPKAKELLITPRGVRLVYQVNQSIRAHYMVLRQTHFENLSLAPELVTSLLDRALALYVDLNSEEQPLEQESQEEDTRETGEVRAG